MKNFLKFSEVSFDDTIGYGKNQRNRKINEANLSKIKKQMTESFDVIPPITVNVVTGNIIDGQTRHKAYLDLMLEGRLPEDTKLKVMFVEIDENEEIEAIINANTNSKNWSSDDYFDSYVKGENDSYAKLEEFCKNHSLTHDTKKDGKIGKKKFRYAACMIKGKDCHNELKQGTFTCTDEEIEHGDKVHSEILDILETLELPTNVHWLGAMSLSWNRYRDMHSYSEWKEALETKKNHKRFIRLKKENQTDWNIVFNELHSFIDLKKAA